MAKESGKRRQSIDVDTDLLKEMVTMAFQGSKVDKLTTEDIYKAVFKNFPNLGSQKKAKLQKLKTSIRTVLSRYECFSKMERAMKGNYWQFNEDVSGDAKRKPASRLPPVVDLSSDTKIEEPDNIQRKTGVVTRRERRRKKANKSSDVEIKPPDEELKESETKSDEYSKEVDMKEDTVTDDQCKTDSPESKGQESSPVVDKPLETSLSTQPPESVDSNVEVKSLKEEPKRNENGINGVTTPIHKTVANHVSRPVPQSSPVPFGHPSSPSASHFGHLPPSNTHFGQPSPSNHSFGSSSPLSNSFGQLSPSFGPPQPPPNYQFGSYCAPNSQFGLPNSQLGYSTSHFGYSPVPIGMPNSHFGYSSVPNNQFYPSPPTHPFGLPSPFHHYPAGHPSNFSPFNTAGSLPHSPNRF